MKNSSKFESFHLFFWLPKLIFSSSLRNYANDRDEDPKNLPNKYLT